MPRSGCDGSSRPRSPPSVTRPRRLDHGLAAGVTDVWAALDDCDVTEMRIARRGGSALQRDLIAVGRATLFWLVTIRCEELHIGLQRLRQIGNSLPDLYRNRP